MADQQDLLDGLPDGVLIADSNGIVTAINSVARHMLGSAARLGAPLSEAAALQDQEAAEWYATVRPYEGLRIQTGIPEQSWLLPDGSEVLVTTRIDRREPLGEVHQVSLVLRSGRGRARLDRERSDLVATVAHELRSPLTGVKGFVTTLLSKWDLLHDDQKKLMLTTVSTDAERLSRLIAELLDVARIDTGRLPLYRRDIDAGPLIERVAESVRSGTSRSIVVSLPPTRAAVFADPDKFVQVVTNLVDNAIRHGDGTVSVSVSEGRLGFRLLVDDEGDGIPEPLRARIFTKFWRHGAGGGTGLGMYLVHGLVRVHGGELHIDDAPSGGARVIVDWPAVDPRA